MITVSAKNKKGRMQFSQKMVFVSAIYGLLIVVAALAANFILLWHDKQPMPQETITTITVYGGLITALSGGGYLALTGVRDCSLNKHGITLNGGN